MGRIGRVLQGKPLARIAATGVAAALLLATVGGVWAFDGAKGKRIDVAASYTVNLSPTETLDDQGGVTWTVGQATLQADCGATYGDPANPGRISMFWGGGVTNNGTTPIGIVSPALNAIDEPPYLNLGGDIYWLEAGQTIDAGPSGPGQVINETNYPGPEGAIMPIAILTEGGASASGTWAWSARVNPEDGTAVCVFSLQMAG